MSQPQFLQMLAQAPSLLVFGCALLAALVAWRRCPLAAGLVACGAVLHLLAWILGAFAFNQLVQRMQEQAAGAESYSLWTSLFWLLVNGLRAIGFALLVAAAFVRRAPATAIPSPADSRHR